MGLVGAKAAITLDQKELLDKCTIEHDEPLEMIRKYDSPGTFHYIAPLPDPAVCSALMLELLSALSHVEAISRKHDLCGSCFFCVYSRRQTRKNDHFRLPPHGYSGVS